MTEYVRVQQKSTFGTPRKVYVPREDWEQGRVSLWGQMSPTDETGWFFDRSDLEDIPQPNK